jgi:hypothetical protein
MKRYPRWAVATGLSLLFLVLAGAVSLHFAGKTLKGQIEQALGEESSVGEISLGLFSITVSDLRIKAPPGWPAEETLHARRIVVAPDWRALLSSRIAVRYVHAEDVHQTVLRESSGRIRILPSLLERPRKRSDASPPEVTIGEVVLSKVSLDFYDATLRKPPYLVRLENVELRLGRFHLPDFGGRTPIELTGIIKGKRSDGSYSLQGDIALGSRDSELITTMRDVDLTTLQPYLVRTADTGVKRGVLDLNLRSTVENRRLDAKGTLKLHDLVLDERSSFMGLPQQAAVNMLKNERQDIQMQFSLQGNLDDPRFSLNESLAMRFSAGLAEALGVSVSGLGKSVGNAATGIGSALRGLFQ